MNSSTPAYLFLKAANVSLSEIKSFPRQGTLNAECTTVALTLILATSASARINTLFFSG